jgi:hypothetical protein
LTRPDLQVKFFSVIPSSLIKSSNGSLFFFFFSFSYFNGFEKKLVICNLVIEKVCERVKKPSLWFRVGGHFGVNNICDKNLQRRRMWPVAESVLLESLSLGKEYANKC